MTDEKADLEVRKSYLHKELVDVYSDIKEIQSILKPMQERYRTLKKEYEEVDYNLALVDGRMEKVTVVKKGGDKKKVKSASLVKKLNKSQIDSIMDKLGLEKEVENG